MENLLFFEAQSNDLCGAIPASIAKCGKLKNFVISDNKFEGEIPPLPDGISKFVVANNQLRGPIPTLPARLAKFEADNNKQLTGTVPALPKGIRSFTVAGNALFGAEDDMKTAFSKVDLSAHDANALEKIDVRGNAKLAEPPPSLQAFNGKVKLDKDEKKVTMKILWGALKVEPK